MIFNSLAFAIFLPCVIILYYFFPFRWQNRMLLAASLLFYGWWNWRLLGLLAFTILVDFYASRAIYHATDHKAKKRWMLLSILTNITVLGIFKYSNFFLQSFSTIAKSVGLGLDIPVLHLILPIGISFYTFMSMAYVIDVYRGELTPTQSLFDFALFVCYFPHLVAGPILRAPQLLPQLTTKRHPNLDQIRDGLALIVIGYVRKVVIGDTLAPMVSEVFQAPAKFGSGDLWVHMVFFTVQVYGDFAGYSDIARGVSKLLGIELNLNFATPFFSTNITEFWRRWHISLGSWLRDYVYIPLGGSRKGKFRTYLNNILTMLVGGLWHGANWTYVVWGTMTGVGLAIHKAFLDLRGKRPERATQNRKWNVTSVVSALATFLVFALSLVMFRSADFATGFTYLSGMFSFSGGITRAGSSLFVSLFVLLGFVVDLAQYTQWGERFIARSPLWKRALVLGTLLFLVLACGADDSKPFFYFQF